ncbi:MAG: hypothetical protein WBM81_14730, partial [Sedimenticolaceae bacterium]
MRHSPEERAAYFLYYHTHATGEDDADLGVLAKYFEEANLPAPDLYSIYDYFKTHGPKALVAPGTV